MVDLKSYNIFILYIEISRLCSIVIFGYFLKDGFGKSSYPTSPPQIMKRNIIISEMV